MKEVYDFFNRNEGCSVKLRIMEDGRYLLEASNVNYFIEHNRKGTGNVKELYSLDPDGGPMLSVGGCINSLLTPGCTDENQTSIEKIEKVDGIGYVFTLCSGITLDEFRGDVITKAKKIQKEYECLRFGQAVFNYIDEEYGVARYVQFDDEIDCFYNDELVDEFIELSWLWYIRIHKGRK